MTSECVQRHFTTVLHISSVPLNIFVTCTVKKGSRFSVPSRDVTYQTLPRRELFPVSDSLISDIPAGDGKTENLFFQCVSVGRIACTHLFRLFICKTLRCSSRKILFVEYSCLEKSVTASISSTIQLQLAL